jgi:hypothetical protein
VGAILQGGTARGDRFLALAAPLALNDEQMMHDVFGCGYNTVPWGAMVDLGRTAS